MTPPLRLAATGRPGGSRRPSASDVDVAVLFKEPPAARLLGGALSMEGALEGLVRRPVQLMVLNTAPADLVHRVLRDA